MGTFQSRAWEWVTACIGDAKARGPDRKFRFLEEALELVQSVGGTRDEAVAVVDYVFNRPVGDPHQEVGGTLLTLATLCEAIKADMQVCGEQELLRAQNNIEKIRAKDARKPEFSPVPAQPPAELGVEELWAGYEELQTEAKSF